MTNATHFESTKRYRLTCRAVFLIGLVFHTLFLISFTHLHVPILAKFNILSVTIFSIALLMNERGYCKLASSVVIFEVITHQTIATIVLGLDAGFQVYILMCIIMPLLTSRGNSGWKLVFISFSSLILIALQLIMNGKEPLCPLPRDIELIFAIGNQIGATILLIGVGVIFNSTVISYEEQLDQRQRYAHSLLLNILPEPIAKRLNMKEEPIADGFTEASVLFADLMNFTELSSTLSPDRLVKLLDRLYARYDILTDIYGCEKIKTIGDSFMVAAGVPEPCDDHAERVVKFGFAILKATEEFNREENMSLQIRIGCNAGPLIAGVIGRKKFTYDLWGDTVNIASRLESSGIAGMIHTTSSIQSRILDGYTFKSRGHIPLKGKGTLETYIIEQIVN